MSTVVPLSRGDQERERVPAGGARHLIDLDTRHAALAERGGSWHRALAQVSVPLNVYSRGDDGFAGRLRADLVGDLRILSIKADAQKLVRSAAVARAVEKTAFYKLVLHLDGHCQLSQDGRTVELTEPAFTVCDTTRAYSLEFNRPYSQQVLMVPRDALSIPCESVSLITATLIPVERGAFRVLAGILRELREDIGELSLRNRLTIAETLIELSEAVLRERLGSTLSAEEWGVFAEILAFVERHLGDPDLTPQVIAATHFMSLRSLQGLFQARDQSPSEWIRRRRLENCRRDLIRLRGDQSISAIAGRWGFTDSGSFSRAFKRAFGMPPQEYRRQHSPDLLTHPGPFAD